MSYTVTWVPAAEQELANIWLNATDRNAVTRAAHAIERRLRRDPLYTGESRTQGTRVAFLPPLACLFRVVEDDLLVEVIHVWET
jgi:hypothetical protein